MTSWSWTLLFLVGRLLGSPALEAPASGEKARLDLSWAGPDLDPDIREGVLRGLTSGSRERALVLGQAARDLDLATSREVHAASVWLLFRGIPSLLVPETRRGLDAELRRVLDELGRRLPSRLLRDFRQTLRGIELPAGENGRVSPVARDLLTAFFTGTARGLEATR
ncbi:MAG TPA: hypothetical protein VMU54_05785 [Planctomycetota bacterium]|nr:hypothetical protein [Planctomycetota bacterium]